MIDFEKLKQRAAQKIKITPVLSTILIGKPSKTDWFMIRTGEGWIPPTLNIFSPEGTEKDRRTYLITDPEVDEFLNELGIIIPAKFYLYIKYNSNVMKIDYVSQKLNKNGGKSEYHITHEDALQASADRWVRMYSNSEAGYYMHAFAEDNLPKPVFPAKPANIEEALDIAFKGNLIDSMEHPEIKILRGKL